nr:dipeptidase 1-like [Nerophis lumbriciformis]
MVLRDSVLLLAIILAAGCRAVQPDALVLHKSAIVIDTHSDFLDRTAIDGLSLTDDVAGAQTTLSQLRAGYIDAQFFSVFVPPAYSQYGFKRRTDELIDRLEEEVNQNAESIELVTSVAGIEQLANSGKVAALLGIEGGHSIEAEIANVDHFYDRGVRYMTLTWSNTNQWADSSGDEPRWGGLNETGRAVVRRMNKLGMMVDISHVSDDTFHDVMATTTSPVIASHSSARALMKHKRNMSDRMIEAVGKNGGVIQVNFYSKHLDQAFADQFNAAMEKNSAKYQALAEQYSDDPVEQDKQLWAFEKALEYQLTPPPASMIVDHIDHIVKVAGIDHVGLGSDFDGMGAPPAGMEHVGKMPNITKELVKRGYGAQDIRKILGGNLMRVLAENERLAK